MWIIIAEIICICAAIGLLAIAFELGEDTPSFVRYLLVGFSIAFFGVGAATFNNRISYHAASAVATAGMGVMALVVIGYLILTHSMRPIVLKIAGGALFVILLLWGVGSFSDIRRQKDQMRSASDSTSTAQSYTANQ